MKNLPGPKTCMSNEGIKHQQRNWSKIWGRNAPKQNGRMSCKKM